VGGGVIEENSTYRDDLALVHDLGFRFHSDRCAPGILKLLEPVRERGGLVVELGCGSGALTRHLAAAGHRVFATDGSAAMVRRAREVLPPVTVERLVLPDDPLPAADAIVGVGNVLNYLGSQSAAECALVAIAHALLPGGVVALDPLDLSWAGFPHNLAPLARVRPTWAIFSSPELRRPDLLVDHVTTFVPAGDGSWRRADERHEVCLLDTARLAAVLQEHGVAAQVGTAFGEERLRDGIVTLVGRRAR
jgi:SAM-dependent methyltransferase